MQLNGSRRTHIHWVSSAGCPSVSSDSLPGRPGGDSSRTQVKIIIFNSETRLENQLHAGSDQRRFYWDSRVRRSQDQRVLSQHRGSFISQHRTHTLHTDNPSPGNNQDHPCLNIRQMLFCLQAGHDLSIKDRGGSSDPYVKFFHDGKMVYKSRTVHKDLNPQWDETFDLIIEDISVPLDLKVNLCVSVCFDFQFCKFSVGFNSNEAIFKIEKLIWTNFSGLFSQFPRCTTMTGDWGMTSWARHSWCWARTMLARSDTWDWLWWRLVRWSILVKCRSKSRLAQFFLIHQSTGELVRQCQHSHHQPGNNTRVCVEWKLIREGVIYVLSLIPDCRILQPPP